MTTALPDWQEEAIRELAGGDVYELARFPLYFYCPETARLVSLRNPTWAPVERRKAREVKPRNGAFRLYHHRSGRMVTVRAEDLAFEV